MEIVIMLMRNGRILRQFINFYTDEGQARTVYEDLKSSELLEDRNSEIVLE